jgi:hypothetical protein
MAGVYVVNSTGPRCWVLHETAELEIEIWGSVQSASIQHHLETCPLGHVDMRLIVPTVR